MTPLIRRLTAGCILLALCAAPAAAQTRHRGGFIALNAAAQTAAADVTDRALVRANAETGSVESRYRASTAALFDGAVGVRVWKRLGAAVAVSHTATSGRAGVSASIPHPFFDDQDRLVEGEASGVRRVETAAHLQLFYEVPTAGRWHVRLFAGPSYMHLEQDLVREVTVTEAYPFDSATFQSALTGRTKGSGIGFNAGADVSWMFARRVGAGALVRYTRARLDLNAPDARSVSFDGGGLQAGAGLRFTF